MDGGYGFGNWIFWFLREIASNGFIMIERSWYCELRVGNHNQWLLVFKPYIWLPSFMFWAGTVMLIFAGNFDSFWSDADFFFFNVVALSIKFRMLFSYDFLFYFFLWVEISFFDYSLFLFSFEFDYFFIVMLMFCGDLDWLTELEHFEI